MADMRAPTPSAAAELAVFDYNEFISKQLYYRQMLTEKMSRIVEQYRSIANQYESGMQMFSPANQLMSKKQYVADLSIKLEESFENLIKNKRHRLEILAEKLNGLSPVSRISKGFAYVTDKDNKALNSIKQVESGDDIMLTVNDGKISAKVNNVFGGIKSE